jgi:hypothetical protein
MDEIQNRVASSALMVFDLEDYYPEGIKTQIDLAVWLTDGFLLKEKEFRQALAQLDWSQYQNHYVAIYCSTDAILPAWAEQLVAVQVLPFAKKVVLGTIDQLDELLYPELLAALDYSVYQDKPVILKGCSKKPVPQSAYILALQYLKPLAKSIMYGEACSAVPLYKKK